MRCLPEAEYSSRVLGPVYTTAQNDTCHATMFSADCCIDMLYTLEGHTGGDTEFNKQKNSYYAPSG